MHRSIQMKKYVKLELIISTYFEFCLPYFCLWAQNLDFLQWIVILQKTDFRIINFKPKIISKSASNFLTSVLSIWLVFCQININKKAKTLSRVNSQRILVRQTDTASIQQLPVLLSRGAKSKTN